jgi:hypothetical protein
LRTDSCPQLAQQRDRLQPAGYLLILVLDFSDSADVSPRVGHWVRLGISALGFGAYRITAISVYGAETTRWIVQSFAVGGTAAALAILVKYGSPVLGAILDVDT